MSEMGYPKHAGTKKRRKGNTSCCVVGCSNAYKNTTHDVAFYSFPRRIVDMDRRKLWIQAVSRRNLDGSAWEPTRSSRICSMHFIGNKRSGHPDNPAYVPSIFPEVYITRVLSSKKRYKRSKGTVLSCTEIQKMEVKKEPSSLEYAPNGIKVEQEESWESLSTEHSVNDFAMENNTTFCDAENVKLEIKEEPLWEEEISMSQLPSVTKTDKEGTVPWTAGIQEDFPPPELPLVPMEAHNVNGTPTSHVTKELHLEQCTKVEEISSEENSVSPIYKCEYCCEYFSSAAKLRMHALIHQDKNVNNCRHCAKSFTCVPELKSHHIMHKDKINCCDFDCVNEQRYKCKTCQKNFMRVATFKRHQKPCKCSVCQSIFVCSSHLKRHFDSLRYTAMIVQYM